QQKVVKDLAAGSVDIVIGTHRLVQDDIAFKDLGLVIIDEEQRFGVMQKEKFKLLRKLVDVLTLSATPIPRTLYLALTGARDMSTIETPPQDRLPVETIVTQYDERVIRDAIHRADRFGLSDLYQLRGRVGRYKHQAYAYLLLPRHAGLLADARKRISAIKQYSTLGSGFKIAMRDLEIRGAGNLLGAEQSGHITAVGFELYCQ